MEIKRDEYLKQLIDSQWNGLVKVITGLRRAGKTYLLFNLYKQYLINNGIKPENIIEIKLDLPQNRKLLKVDTLWKYIQNALKDNNQQYYILIDEIQMVKHFETIINGLISLKNVDSYITGSNSKFLSTDIKTEIRGRGWFIHVYPLSFKEFIQLYDQNEIKTKAWSDFISFGGLPQLSIFKNNDDKIKYLKSIASLTYIKDIVEKNKIKNEDLLNDIIHILADNTGSLTNPLRICNCYKSIKSNKISPNQVKSYINNLENAFLIKKAYRYDIKGNSYYDTPLKYYFEDLGIRNSIVGLKPTDFSHIIENIIFNELKLRGFEVNIGVVNNVIKDKNNKSVRTSSEIDFVASKQSSKFYIQYSTQMASESFQREIAPLFCVKDGYTKIIITNNLPTYRNDDGIWFVNIFDFLLDSKILG